MRNRGPLPARVTLLAKCLLLLLATGVLISVPIAWSVSRALQSLTYPLRRRVPITVTIGGVEPREISFHTGDGLTLRGWYLPSRSGAAILLAHGHGESRVQMLPEAEFLARAGYGVLLFDWRAHGESDGAVSTRGVHERLDLNAAVEFIASQPGVRPDGVGALGFSRGGNVILEVASREPRLRAIVVEAVAYSAVESLREDVGGWRMPFVLWALRRKDIDVEELGPARHICEISPRPIFVLVGTRDEALPATKRLFDAACEPKEFWLVPDAEHGHYDAVAGLEYRHRILAFFARSLLATPQPSGAANMGGHSE